MKRLMAIGLAFICLALSGCSWMDGRHISVTPHREQNTLSDQRAVAAANYSQLCAALENAVRAGSESVVIHVPEYPQNQLTIDIATAVRYTRGSYPMGAFAVEEITYEIGTTGARPAIAVSISYLRSRIEIQRVRQVATMEEAHSAITGALDNCDPSIVLLVDEYRETDFAQLVTDYALANPQIVMELPQVTAAAYPESGQSRVLELTFGYESSRESLRSMQSQVAPVFASAALYVSGEGSDAQKYAQLYAFLMKRFDYEIATSITPAYSLLRHGVGDHRAFATVFAAMCRRAGLECMVVTGTRDGAPWNWNIVLTDGRYFHVDLLRCSQTGGFRQRTDGEMTGYVWDYSAYPACTGQPAPENPEN